MSASGDDERAEICQSGEDGSVRESEHITDDIDEDNKETEKPKARKVFFYLNLTDFFDLTNFERVAWKVVVVPQLQSLKF